MISPCIPIIFIDHFMTLLYVTFYYYYYYSSNPGVRIFGCSLYWDQLWLDKKIYTVERLIQIARHAMMSVLSECPYYPGVHLKFKVDRLQIILVAKKYISTCRNCSPVGCPKCVQFHNWFRLH